MRSAPITTAGFIVVAALTLGGCGGSTTVSEETSGPSATSPRASSETPGDDAPAAALVVTRSGGIAGLRDMVQVAADGTAQITRKTGGTRRCMPSAKALDRLRAIDFTALVATTSQPPMSDGFNYSVRSASGSASAGEGDDDGRRAEFVDAAAAVVASCLSSQGPDRG